ncbi:MAG TPA: hypothetical protein VL282_05010, partial [Tepidisphaeraceae bacterium]|nr:hypothetical protein [Tepidisphaeraceae bacterium]
MRIIRSISALLVFCLCAAPLLGATPTTSTTGPKEGEDTILDGAIIFVPPEGWQELSRDPNKIQYNSPDHKGTIVVTGTPQEVNLNKTVADQMGMMIKKKVAQAVKATGGEFLISPRVEKDDLIFL